MKNVFLGEYVKQRRLDLGLTQEQLCDGICEPMTLSRLENGKQTPSRNRINALLQRLGLPDDRYFALLSKNELEMEALQKEIVACNVTEKVPEGFEKLAQFEKLADPDDQIAQQFALRSRVLLGRLDGRYTPLEQIDLLMQAIQLTVPRFDLESIESFLYTRDEITIINQIGLAYSDAGQNKKAAEIYYQLLKYVRKHFKETITSIGVLPLVLYNYVGYWICAVAMRKELHSLKKDEKPVFNMDITKYCPDVWKLKRNADILWAMTKSAKNCTTNRIISAKSLDIKSG